MKNLMRRQSSWCSQQIRIQSSSRICRVNEYNCLNKDIDHFIWA